MLNLSVFLGVKELRNTEFLGICALKEKVNAEF